MKVVITGSSGFIGFHATKKFLDNGFEVIGIDNENDYYDKELKTNRRKILLSNENFKFECLDLSKNTIIERLNEISPDFIVNLAAQAGVRHSLKFPHDYTRSNIDSFLNILEYAKSSDSLQHLVYASTSSVYGANTDLPFQESHGVDHPLQYYAVTKRANELMAHSYSNLYNIRTTGLRFFTVYGPWGRPDMALFLFTDAILKGEPIKVFNNGNHKRDFTYVDDIVQGIFLSTTDTKFINPDDHRFKNPSISKFPFRILNIGRGKPENLEDFITEIEENLGKKANKEYLPMQPGDVPTSHADISEIMKLGYKPETSISKGVKNFIEWYLDYYNIKL